MKGPDLEAWAEMADVPCCAVSVSLVARKSEAERLRQLLQDNGFEAATCSVWYNEAAAHGAYQTIKQRQARGKRRLERMLLDWRTTRRFLAADEYKMLRAIRDHARTHHLPVPDAVRLWLAWHEAAQRQAYGQTLSDGFAGVR